MRQLRTLTSSPQVSMCSMSSRNIGVEACTGQLVSAAFENCLPSSTTYDLQQPTGTPSLRCGEEPLSLCASYVAALQAW